MKNSPINLYPYQEKIVNTSIDILKKKNRCLIVVPTGGGKTIIFSEIIRRTKMKTLIIAHTKEIVDQNNRTVKIMDLTSELVQIETIQKLSHRSNKLNHSDKWDLIVIDECHRICAPSYMDFIKKCPNSKILGVTATPYRCDNKKITKILGFPQEPLSLIDLIKEGFLCNLVGHRIKTTIDLSKVVKTSSTKDFSSGALESVINVKKRNEIILKEWKRLATEEKTLGFAATVKHCIELAKVFNKDGISSEVIHGQLPISYREKILADFKEGKINVLWNCQVLTEGFDEPSIKCILMARPTLSKKLYIQMVGRGTRKYPEKEFCRIIEFTDNNYDVCDLKDLLQLPRNSVEMQPGENIVSYSDRIKSELLESTTESVEVKWDVLNGHIEAPATDFQITLLRRYKIKCPENITEFRANLLLAQFLMEKENGLN